MTNGNLALLRLGATRPGLGGLSATVPGLRQCHICKWPDIQAEMLFGPQSTTQAGYRSYAGWFLGGFGSVPSVGGVSIGSMVSRVVVGVGVY